MLFSFQMYYLLNDLITFSLLSDTIGYIIANATITPITMIWFIKILNDKIVGITGSIPRFSIDTAASPVIRKGFTL